MTGSVFHDAPRTDAERLAFVARLWERGQLLGNAEALETAVSTLLGIAERGLHRLVCSWCGDDYERGDWDSADCCSCDPVPVSSLPNLLKDARREAKEALDAAE